MLRAFKRICKRSGTGGAEDIGRVALQAAPYDPSRLQCPGRKARETMMKHVGWKG